jgi:hypothetical protein
VGASRTGGKEQVHVHAGNIFRHFFQKYPDGKDSGREFAGLFGPCMGRQAEEEAEQKGKESFHFVS